MALAFTGQGLTSTVQRSEGPYHLPVPGQGAPFTSATPATCSRIRRMAALTPAILLCACCRSSPVAGQVGSAASSTAADGSAAAVSAGPPVTSSVSAPASGMESVGELSSLPPQAMSPRANAVREHQIAKRMPSSRAVG